MDKKKIEEIQKALKDGGNIIKSRDDRVLILVGNFRLFGNPSDCVHEPIPVEDSNDSFIFEIEVKGPRKLVLAENQMYPA